MLDVDGQKEQINVKNISIPSSNAHTLTTVVNILLREFLTTAILSLFNPHYKAKRGLDAPRMTGLLLVTAFLQSTTEVMISMGPLGDPGTPRCQPSTRRTDQIDR